MFPCVGLKQKVFAWGGTVISAVLLHIYSCTFSVGHLVLLNDVKLRLMQADARLSTANKKPLCDDEQKRTDTLYMTIHTHTRKPRDIEWPKQSFNCSLMSLIYCCYLWCCVKFRPVGLKHMQAHTHIGVVSKICFALVHSDRGYL